MANVVVGVRMCRTSQPRLLFYRPQNRHGICQGNGKMCFFPFSAF